MRDLAMGLERWVSFDVRSGSSWVKANVQEW